MTSFYRITAQAIGLCAATAALAACTGANSSLAGPAVIPDQGSGTQSSASHSASDKSWMTASAAAIKKILYLSDAGRDAVLVYDFGTGKQLGMLTGFQSPAGQCVDKKGDVWIADSDARSLVEYPRGAITPIRTLSTGGRPVGCSVAPNGDLAAAENPGSEDQPSAIVVWSANASLGAYTAPGATFATPNCGTLSTPGYDNHNNLYVECMIADLTSIYELRNGAQSLQKVSFNRSIVVPGGVMWDGKYITFADRNFHFRRSTAIYRATESAAGALALAGTTELTDACSAGSTDVLSPYIVGNANTPANDRQATTVIGDNRACGGTFDYWTYPNESNQVKSLPSAPAYATGASVSIL
ncbi:MAG: hypothetical protein WB609_02185 [Candidatus Cybelea sp.]